MYILLYRIVSNNGRLYLLVQQGTNEKRTPRAKRRETRADTISSYPTNGGWVSRVGKPDLNSGRSFCVFLNAFHLCADRRVNNARLYYTFAFKYTFLYRLYSQRVLRRTICKQNVNER